MTFFAGLSCIFWPWTTATMVSIKVTRMTASPLFPPHLKDKIQGYHISCSNDLYGEMRPSLQVEN